MFFEKITILFHKIMMSLINQKKMNKVKFHSLIKVFTWIHIKQTKKLLKKTKKVPLIYKNNLKDQNTIQMLKYMPPKCEFTKLNKKEIIYIIQYNSNQSI